MIVGIDVSKSTFDCAWSKEHQAFDYTDEGIGQLLNSTPEASYYVMEATGVYHTHLAVRLHQSGRKVCVVNPLVIKRFGQMQLTRVKSDKADAQLIRDYGELNALVEWSPSADELIELRQARSWLDDLIKEQTRLLNREEAHQHQAGASHFVRQQINAQKKHLKQQIKSCERHLEVVVKKSFPELYERLQTIPSIGKKTALELIVITDGFERFDNVKSLSAYTGVSPTTYSSGTSVQGKGGIAKMGQGRIRQLLYLCSWTAKRCNTACRLLNERLLLAGKPPKVINIAIAHKLLRQAFAVAKSGNNYEASCA